MASYSHRRLPPRWAGLARIHNEFVPRIDVRTYLCSQVQHYLPRANSDNPKHQPPAKFAPPWKQISFPEATTSLYD